MSLKHLFSAIALGKVEIKNRIAMAPMGLGNFSPDGSVDDRTLAYVEARSRGGAGLIISESVNVSKHQKPNLLGAYDDRFIPGLSKYADTVHKHDAKAFLQIGMLGGKYDSCGYAPSAIDSPLYLSRPKELTTSQVREVIDEFVEAARRARKAGFDGVELHGAHSYLVGEFISPHFNRRDDEYGGDFERRMRFPTTIVQGIKNVCGDDFPIGFKFSAWEEVPNGVDHELALRIAQRMVDEGVAYIHTQTTAYYPPLATPSRYPTMPPMYVPRNTLLELAERVKRKIRKVPVVAAGGIVDPHDADNMIALRKADMVALGRALLADAEWPNKAEKGKRIRPCIRCNVCHYEAVCLQRHAVCSVNPYLVHELEGSFDIAKKRKKVAVVGAGPAGIVAALTASRRGHDVILCEKENRVGGLLTAASIPEFKADVRALLEYYRGEIKDSRVRVKLNTNVTPDMVLQLRPDALIIAVGAPPVRPDTLGIDRGNVTTAEEALRNPGRVKGKNVAVLGGGTVGCEMALYLAEKGKRVVIVELLDNLLATEEIKNNTVVLEHLLEKSRVRAYTRSKVVEIAIKEMWIITDREKMRRIPADTVVLALGRKPNLNLIEGLRQCCLETYLIGDSVKQGGIFEAVHDADRIGRLL
jgi:2,4-dienoyl-CoA reductase-like NADH-dependent reductase (Old Yellow Enzyme family)/thioredoxin reductase